MRPAAAASVLVLLSLLPVSLHARHDSPIVAARDSQEIQNARADAYDLTRMQNTAMVRQFYKAGFLVKVPGRTQTYYLHSIPSSYRYLRPWTDLFLERLSEQYYSRFGQPLRVTSLVRTVWLQRRMERWNPNAADAHGDTRSSHLTGATLDISKHGMSWKEIVWMRQVLLSLKQEGLIYPIEEFQEPNFHIMVYPTYREYVARVTGRPDQTDADDNGSD